MSSEQDSNYGADDIDVLEGLEAVRERPGMYIGNVDEEGYNHLIYEVVDNSIDEALAGYCDKINLIFHGDGSVSVVDNGRGIPIGETEDNIPAVQRILTTLHAGGKFGDGDDSASYEKSGGLHGVGVSAVNALSEYLTVTVWRNGGVYKQEYERGEPVSSLYHVRDMEDDEETGTKITFLPDDEIFRADSFNKEKVNRKMEQTAYLTSGISLTVTDETEEHFSTVVHDYDGGIVEFVRDLNETKSELHDTIYYISGTENNIDVEFAFQLTDSVGESIHSYANNISTEEGGTHMTGLKTALTRILNSYAEDNDLFSGGVDSFTGEDVRDGMTGILSVRHAAPDFEGQTKTKLTNRDARSAVSSIVHEQLEEILIENKDFAETFVEKCVRAAKARKASEKAKKETMRDTPLNNTRLPTKLADCQAEPENSELFIVEGDSAGGSAKQARDPETQAVLPLSGKILNTEKNRLDKILDHDQIQNIISAIGGGVGDEFDIDDIRYETIILFTDADVDGEHIQTLLLTLFYRYLTPLLEEGHVYAAKPPLYRIRDGKETIDAMTEAEKERIVEEECSTSDPTIQRFKGLGEMNPDQLWDTTMDPNQRHLVRLSVENSQRADKTFSRLMGTEVEPRRRFISENAQEADWDI